jgi:4'-phosphopantetheinyl transferase
MIKNKDFVDIWHGKILTTNEEEHYLDFLNEEEKIRASKFYRLELQKKYIKTRGVLRKILASYTGDKPQDIVIKLGEYGKPYIQGLAFNLSHTDNHFALAVSSIEDIGLDMEKVTQRYSLSGIAKKCFSTIEFNYWNAMPEQQKETVFYHFWVRKEAFVKAVGRGISLGLDQCVVNPKDQSQFLSIPSDYGLALDWKIIDIPIAEEIPCVVVVRNKPFEQKIISYQGQISKNTGLGKDSFLRQGA